MFFKLKFVTLAALFALTNGAYIYSSFWAPIFNPKILNYRVDAKFDENGGKYARNEFETKYGYRGERLISDLGNGIPPNDNIYRNNNGDVKFYYTYKGADGQLFV